MFSVVSYCPWLLPRPSWLTLGAGRSPRWGIKYGGAANSGSSLVSQILYEPYHAKELRLSKKVDFFIPFLISLNKFSRVALFLVEINPVLLTSKQLSSHWKPVMSVMKGVYFWGFLLIPIVNVHVKRACKFIDMHDFLVLVHYDNIWL